MPDHFAVWSILFYPKVIRYTYKLFHNLPVVFNNYTTVLFFSLIKYQWTTFCNISVHKEKNVDIRYILRCRNMISDKTNLYRFGTQAFLRLCEQVGEYLLLDPKLQDSIAYLGIGSMYKILVSCYLQNKQNFGTINITYLQTCRNMF